MPGGEVNRIRHPVKKLARLPMCVAPAPQSAMHLPSSSTKAPLFAWSLEQHPQAPNGVPICSSTSIPPVRGPAATKIASADKPVVNPRVGFADLFLPYGIET
jgi:hypothetical protein